MKLYQSMTHTWPSGPTSAMIGAHHSSAPASRFQALREEKSAPFPFRANVATRWPVGSVTKAARFQYSRGYVLAGYSEWPAAAVKWPKKSTCRTLSVMGYIRAFPAIPPRPLDDQPRTPS